MGLFSRKKAVDAQPVQPTVSESIPDNGIEEEPIPVIESKPSESVYSDYTSEQKERELDLSVEPGRKPFAGPTSVFDGINEPKGWEMHKPVRVMTRVYNPVSLWFDKDREDYIKFCMRKINQTNPIYGLRTDLHQMRWQGWLTGCTISDIVEQLKEGRTQKGEPLIENGSIIEFIPPHGIGRAVILDQLDIRGPFDFCPLQIMEEERAGYQRFNLHKKPKVFAPWTDAYYYNCHYNGSETHFGFHYSCQTFPRTVQALYITNEGVAVPMRISSDLRQLSGILLPDSALETPCPSAHIRREKLEGDVSIFSFGGVLTEPIPAWNLGVIYPLWEMNRILFKTIKDESGNPVAETYGCGMINFNCGTNGPSHEDYKERLIGNAIILGFDEGTGLPRGLTENEIEKYRQYHYAEEWHPISEKFTIEDRPYIERLLAASSPYDEQNERFDSKLWPSLIKQLEIPQKAMFAFDADTWVSFWHDKEWDDSLRNAASLEEYLFLSRRENYKGMRPIELLFPHRKKEPGKDWYEWQLEPVKQEDIDKWSAERTKAQKEREQTR